MKWWDDLWLNESFANFISMFALENVNSKLIRKVQYPIVNFRDTKTRGYIDDERNNATRPIRGVVRDTSVAQSNFDGIVYGKGAAVINQMCNIVGFNNFSLALGNYFERFAWNNATLTDLLDDMRPYFPLAVNIGLW